LPEAISRRTFGIACIALLSAQAVVLVTSALQESQTFDEAIHLSAGVSYWRTGDYRLNPEHPALPKLMCGLPVLFTGAELDTSTEAWRIAHNADVARHFLYFNKIPADVILFVGRVPTMALTLLLGLVVALWTRRYFGPLAGLIALALLVLDPNMVAHGRYVTTDVWAAATSFFACAAWGEALMRRSMRWYAIAGVALGLALGSKFSTIFLIPVFLLLAVVRRPSWRGAVLTAAMPAVVLAVLYAPEVVEAGRAVITGERIQTKRLAVPLKDVVRDDNWGSKRLYHIGKALHLPSFSWLLGLHHVFKHNREGHASYLLGQISEGGWPHYFLVAFAVKTPAAVLGLCAIALGILAWKRPKPRFEMLVVAIPLLVYIGFTISSKLNIGIRHLLPAYVFLYPLIAVALARFVRPAIWGAALLVLAVEFASIYPHYLAFFNLPSGGPSSGPQYLLDSNIDWGQDTKKLKRYLDAHGIKAVCGFYFGQAYYDLFGIHEDYLPEDAEVRNGRTMDCLVAISVTPLYGAYVGREKFAYLRALKPVERIGYSIYVYDFRKQKH
jgi:4-amino-4-deoxy-L-arabinose transferase-like glycosyltransferase